MEKTILIIAANPKDTPRLRIDEEIKEIEKSLKTSKITYKLELSMASTSKDMRKAILNTEPSMIHFCGHGHGESGIALEDKSGNTKLIATHAITKLFQLFSYTVDCVLLNACYSEVQAQAMSLHIDYVIGMNSAIGDKAAIEFASGFYDAISAGKSYEFAYQMGCSAIEMEGILEQNTPVLITKHNNPVKTTKVYQTFNNKTVFLAEVADDLQKQRTEVKNFLEQHNINVIPREMYYFPNSSDSLMNQIDNDLKKCDLYIQMFNETSPQRPPGMSTPELQYERAIKNNQIPILTWHDRSLDINQVQNDSLLNIIKSSNIMVTLLADFKDAIIKKLTDLTDIVQKNDIKHKQMSDNYVFINTSQDPEDICLANKIFDLLKNNGVYPSLPILENIKASAKRRDLEDNLKTCDAVIVLYGQSELSWVREQLNQCKKIIRKRKKNPFKIIGIYDQPKKDNSELRMALPKMEILECPSIHAETCLPKFLHALGIT